jgi:uncharacterized protein YdeI (YjbR/CyaY-like superfamily)
MTASRGRTADAANVCQRRSKKPEREQWVARFEELRSMCLTAMDQQAKTKWMTPERMGL